jgi:hypothetical protein
LVDIAYPIKLSSVSCEFRRFQRFLRAAIAANKMAANTTHILRFPPSAHHTSIAATDEMKDDFVAAVKTAIKSLWQKDISEVRGKPSPAWHLPLFPPPDLPFSNVMQNLRNHLFRQTRGVTLGWYYRYFIVAQSYGFQLF